MTPHKTHQQPTPNTSLSPANSATPAPTPAQAPQTSQAQIQTAEALATTETRYQRGQRALAEIDGEAGQKVIDALADIAPDFARYVIEFPFGDIYTRPGLSLREREIATIAALCALGNATPQLKVHIHASLNVGLTRAEITETLMQIAVYAGFPAALNGLFAAKEVFASHNETKAQSKA
ncbi:4-carboxymuconolactone decarboxylase [Thalassospira marina]|uniref:4-carboxymuconolactone decarboxylase n=1 Tax=Thalassospira marina TaxID=2048283 RepID=A0ABN5FFA1_9PROT|nr:4-carboxymuconolactone decarboxylase [Thalassospira marina]